MGASSGWEGRSAGSRSPWGLADDGPGIPEEHADDVFDPGFTTKADGTGFGMASVAQIVAAHDWQISVGEGIDGGARFEIVVDAA